MEEWSEDGVLFAFTRGLSDGEGAIVVEETLGILLALAAVAPVFEFNKEGKGFARMSSLSDPLTSISTFMSMSGSA